MREILLKQYRTIVEFLGKALGSDFEIVLHEISAGKKSIAAIANGHISGRMVNAPLTDLALKSISAQSYKTSDYILNYKGIAENNKELRSSTMFIKDETGNLVGMLCINYDMSKLKNLTKDVGELFQSFGLSDLLVGKNEKETHTEVVENFSKSIFEVVKSVLDVELAQYDNVPVSRLSMDEKLVLVEALDRNGVFLLKGAVPETASQLNCSEASIYRYLSKINKIRSRKEAVPILREK